jgi:hypothetical protein
MPSRSLEHIVVTHSTTVPSSVPSFVVMRYVSDRGHYHNCRKPRGIQIIATKRPRSHSSSRAHTTTPLVQSLPSWTSLASTAGHRTKKEALLRISATSRSSCLSHCDGDLAVVSDSKHWKDAHANRVATKSLATSRFQVAHTLFVQHQPRQ